MARRLVIVVSVVLALAACNGGNTGPAATNTPSGSAGVVAPPTAASSNSLVFPPGTLILIQSETGQAATLAQTPDLRVIRIDEAERTGRQISPDSRYGVRFQPVSSAVKLVLVDYNTNPPTTKDIPNGVNLSGPVVTWAPNGAGFAFYDFPANPAAQAGPRTILYYDVAKGETKNLIPEQAAGNIATSISFSPDGKYLLYAVSRADSEAIGGPDSKPFILDIAAGKSTELAAGTLTGFTQWLMDSSGFVALQNDPATQKRGVYIYRLNALNAPQRLTPADQEDLYASLSRDGRFIATTSTGAGQQGNAANIYVMNLESRSRRMITTFTDPDQAIPQLIWALDGIYYSLAGSNNSTTTWRMGPDGSNPAQIAQGTLQSIVGLGG